jgi:L-serine dehydratase
VFAQAQHGKSLVLAGKREIAFDPAHDIVFDTKTKPPFHPNTLAFTAEDRQGGIVLQQRWCSVGGGFILREGEAHVSGAEVGERPFTFANAAQLLQLGSASGLTIAEMICANESAQRPEADVYKHLHRVRETMLTCVDRGLIKSGELPGGLKVKRGFPPLESRRGVRPSQAAKLRPVLKLPMSLAVARIVAAISGPTPGMLVKRPAVSSALTFAWIS